MKNKTTLIDRLIDHFGNRANAALEMKVDRQIIYNWINQGYIPHHRGAFIQKATGGAITESEVWVAAAKARPLQKPKRRHP